MLRQQIIRQTRCFSTVPRLYKGPVETAKDTLKSVDRTISDAAVAGIEKGQEAAAKAKAQMPSASEAKGKAEELTGQTSGKASELAGEAKGKAAELRGEAKGKAEEVKQKM